MPRPRSILLSFIRFLLACALLGCGGQRSIDTTETLLRLAEDKDNAVGLLAAGDYQAVIDLLAPWVDREIRDPQVYATTAKAQWKLQAYDEAVASYEQALRIDYSDAYSHMELAEILMELGKIGRAHTEFELAIQYASNDALPYYNYGLALHRMGDKEAALAHWTVAYSLAPNVAAYAEAVGIGLTGTDNEEALRYFERADSLGADGSGFHHNFGLLLQRLGEYERAESELEKAIAGDPGNTDYQRSLGVLLLVAGRFETAVPLWEELLRIDPDDPFHRVYLGRAYLETGRPDSAIGLLEGWVSAKGTQSKRRANDTPGLDEAVAVLALSYRAMGDLGRATAYIREALELEPNNVEYLIDYGVILAEDGKIAGAKALWNRVLQIDPENETAKRNLSVYEP
jgi:tetratricopeptide (TPR) repeat protein